MSENSGKASASSRRRAAAMTNVYDRYLSVRHSVLSGVRRRVGMPTDGNHQSFARLRLPYEVMVYFADLPVNLYQLRQWLAPFERLSRAHPVVILTRSSATYALLVQETALPVVRCRFMAGVDDLVRSSDIKMCLYVNQNQSNFQVLAFTDMLHVFLSHGESEKSYTMSNQAKAYDYVFVAGDAAIERIEKSLLNLDDARLLPIGRPSIDLLDDVARSDGSRITVLYAPTWEGDRPSMAYGSLKTHGPALVSALLADARFRVIVRPHPRSGVIDPAYGEALHRVKRMVKDARNRDPNAGHRIDEVPLFGPQMYESDVMIGDVSAVAIDYLSTGKPLIVTRPENPAAIVDEAGMLASTYPLDARGLDRVTEVVAQAVDDDPMKAQRDPWARYFFGDITPGASTQRFLAACDEVIARRDELISVKRSKLTETELSRD